MRPSESRNLDEQDIQGIRGCGFGSCPGNDRPDCIKRRPPEQCGYCSDSTGTARYANCITDAVIIRVEHQGDHPGEDQCVDGREDAYLGPTTEIKWAWAIGGSPGNHC